MDRVDKYYYDTRATRGMAPYGPGRTPDAPPARGTSGPSAWQPRKASAGLVRHAGGAVARQGYVVKLSRFLQHLADLRRELIAVIEPPTILPKDSSSRACRRALPAWCGSLTSSMAVTQPPGGFGTLQHCAAR
jgi:hypothetical protein